MSNGKKDHISRRGFMKGSLAGAALFGTSPVLWLPRYAHGFSHSVSPHPNISALRVVGVHDPRMTREAIPVCHWALQESLVVDKIVEENIDRMALALTQEKRIRDAWRAIFVKPPGKGWPEVVVAIKSNNIGRQHIRGAVMRKICRVLVNEMDIKATNIVIYDGIHGDNMRRKTPYKLLPDGCQIMDRWAGVNTPVPVPQPWKGGREEANCLKNVARGEVDILINTALCKGHAMKFGGFTMTMKNHFGTFDPKWGHRTGATDYLLAVNMTPEILGEMDPRSRKVIFPRQQLCFIDALWASEKGPHCESSDQPNRLYMGVFSPVLDYQVANRFRRDIMYWKVNEEVTPRFLSAFGLSTNDLPLDGGIIDALNT